MPTQQPFDIASLHTAYRDGLNPVDVVEEVFRRLAEIDDPGIFLHVIDKETILQAARTLGPFDPVTKPLWGLPFAIKDNIDATGMPTTAACPDFAYTPKKDAFVVSLLRQAGALLIGKTNLDQFATGLVGIRTPYPAPRNVINPVIVPGGSSSGSAIAVAAGIVSFSLGTDTAGSGRVPAALNGIVGLKPTLGLISNSGVVPACRTLDTVSIFATTVADAHRVHQCAAVYDPEDSFARAGGVAELSSGSAHFRVGVPSLETREFFGDETQSSSFQDSLDGLRAMGAEIVDLDFAPFYEVAALLYDGSWVAERYSVVEDLLRDRPDSLHPVFKRVVKQAETHSSADVFRGIYRLQDLKRKTAAKMAGLDMLCVPSIPTFYTLDDLEADPIGPNSRLGTYTNFVNLLDLCGIAVPVTPREDGLPGSVTLLAAAGRDAQIAAVAAELHQKCSPPVGGTYWTLPAQTLPSGLAASDEMEIAAAGAHMSGLPLNYQLTDLGGRFLRSAKTSTDYKLFRLPGGPPDRPGLVSGASGASIDLEIWALPVSRVGEFLNAIPAPLGIGTITLDTDETVKGFICEASGVTEAEDITSFGGWRGYLNSLSTNPTHTKELDYEKT
jgi:allophanate hydrolase